MTIDITNDQSLADLSARIAAQPMCALDTEFIGERTYWPKLALVQVSYPQGQPVLIDPLQINDWTPFHRVLRDHSIIKIVHGGRQDVDIFFRQMGAVPCQVFDTQIAASLCGFGAQIGYADLVDRIVGRRLEKDNSFTDWLRRPLSSHQLAYARDDVRYLCRIYRALRARLTEMDRAKWADDEMERRFAAEEFAIDPAKQWLKVKRYKSLGPRHWAVMQDLAAWRLSTAQHIDRPIRSVLSDEALIEASRAECLTLEDLKNGRAFARFSVAKYGAELVRIHAAARRKPKTQWPNPKESRRTTSRDQQLQVDLAWVLIQGIARRHRIAPTKIITKRSLPNLLEALPTLADHAVPPTVDGWRWALIGPTLRRLIDGDVFVGIRNGRVVWTTDPDGSERTATLD